MKNFKNILYAMSFVAVFLIGACDNMNDIHQQYLEGGERIYAAKPLNVEGKAGFKRVQLSWNFTSVNKIETVYVRYDDKELTYPIESSKDTLMVKELDNLEEDSYNFSISTVDYNGNESLVSDVYANAYGDDYQKDLNTQKLADLNFDENLMLSLRVSGDFKNLIGYIFTYQDKEDNTISEYFDRTINSHVIDAKIGSELSITSAYLPEETAIDTIYSDIVTYTAPKAIALDKTLFELVNLQMDIPRYDPTVPDNEKDWYSVWDGDDATKKAYLHNNNPKPSFITLDLGVKAILTKYRVVGFSWPFITPRVYQVWGIGDDEDIFDVATTTDIHDVSSLSEEDQADPEKVAAKKEENFAAWQAESIEKGWKLLIDEQGDNTVSTGYTQEITDETAVKYVRIVFIDNFHGTNPDIGMNELYFTGEIVAEY